MHEEVEAVSRHQPAPHRGGVGVDRPDRATEDGERRAGHVRLEQVEEEEALRPVGRAGDGRHRRNVARAAPVAGEVDRRGRVARVLERLEHRHRLGAEVLLVHVEDRVEKGLARAGRANRRERGPVLDDPALAAVVPDEMRNPVDVGVGAGRDRRQADRRQRGKRRDPAPVIAVLGEELQRGRPVVLSRTLEGGRGEAVDHDQDQLLGH